MSKVVLSALLLCVAVFESTIAQDEDIYNYFYQMVVAFSAVEKTGLPDKGLPPLDPYDGGDLLTNTYLGNNSAYLSFMYVNSTLNGFSYNAEIENFDVSTSDNYTYYVNFTKNITTPTLVSPGISILGIIGGQSVDSLAPGVLTADSLARNIAYGFDRGGDNASFVLWSFSQLDPGLEDGNLFFAGNISDVVQSAIDSYYDECVEQNWSNVNWDYFQDESKLFQKFFKSYPAYNGTSLS